jgi:purine-binding chemotaxis protein CheW
VTVTTWIAGRRYALPVERVREVRRAEAITPVPHAPPHVLGLSMVRGRLVAVIDAAVALGAAPAPPPDDPRVVLLAVGDRLVGVQVERVDGVVATAAGGEPLAVERLLEGA